MHEIASAPPEDSADPDLYVVGVGASAGGLEALERLFKAMPGDTGMAFVVIQHLSPDFKSLMNELLARYTAMPIHRVEDGMAVEANSVYLIPPKKDMIISGGRLLLTDKDPQQDLSLPIDRFFRSLAQDRGRRAVAIVLSGTGSDGSRGVRDVHEAGGAVFAQDDETAKFDGMPKSARDTGVVDFVLAPEEMPNALLDHAAIERKVSPASPAAALSETDVIFKLLRDQCGIDFSYYKPNTIGRRIERRLTLTHSVDLDGYVDRLRTDADELNALYRDLLIGVTRFFRDREAFDRLEREVIPELLTRKKPDEELRIWTAGCATGEEAYSLAILVDERIKLLGRPMAVKVFASDVHRASLEVASAGVYDAEKLAEVTPARLDRYFVRKQDGYHVSNELRQMMVFAAHNLIKDAPFTRLDMISCRNMLIYLQPVVQKKILSLFHFGLRTGGVLFLGPSESPGDLSAEFDDLDQHWKIYRKRRDIRLPPDMRLPLSGTYPPPRAAGHPSPPGGADATLMTAYDRLLDRYMPPGLLVTDRRHLLHSFGAASRHLSLRPGRTTADVLDLVSGDLKLPLAGALQRAAKDKKPVVFSGVPVRTEDGEERLKLTVEPILNRQSNLTHLFVALESLGAPHPPAAAATELAADQASRELVTSLESELHYTRESLQATVEELETSNEEMQAANEELVASNEELQSTNEELHSVNEELYTVNAEYQKKITELTELTDDMDNLLRSTDIGSIFLDRNLCIRKFTPQIGRVFDLLSHDVGRRIDSFSHNIRYADLLADLAAVLDGGPPVEKEVRDRHGNWFFLRILPYRSHSALAGVVLSLIDISLLKRAESRLRQMSAIVESSNDAIVGLGLDGRIVTWNRGAEKLFGHTAAEVIDRSFALLRPEGGADGAQREWIPEAIESVRAGRSDDYSTEAVRRRKDGTNIDVQLSVSPIFDSAGALDGVSLIARDITERKRAEWALAERARLTALRADVAVALARNEELPAILQSCARIILDYLDAALARIWILNPAERVLELQASAGLYTHTDGPHGRVPMGAQKIGRIAEGRRPLFTNDVARDPQIDDHGWAEREGMVAFAGYPLVMSDRAVGVLAVFARRELPRTVLDDLASVTYEIAQCVERKRAEEAGQRYAHDLEAINRELRESVARRQKAEEEARDGVERRDRFLAILSHELRNPLAAVLNSVQLLESAGQSEEVRRHAQGAIGRQSQQMSRLLDDLLDVSRITRNRIDIRKRVLDVRDTSRDAIDAIRSSADARGHRLRVELDREPLMVDGDPARLQQIQVNLLANAVKYTPPGGQIWLSACREGGEAVLRVRDTGPGIPPAEREKIFDLFVQLEGAVGDSDGGMGVGLTLVRSLVQLHGGTVAVQSDGVGTGSEFVVRLPLAKRPPRADMPAAPPAALAGLRVLVVDDNADIRTTTLELLRIVGCAVEAAEDGVSGIDAVGRFSPDVALIDIGMPGLNGYEVARRIRALPGSGSLTLIAVTGFGQEDDRAKALEAGFSAHLVKPIDLSQLSAVVSRMRPNRTSHPD